MTKTYNHCLSQLKNCLDLMLIDCQDQNWQSLSGHEREREAILGELQLLEPDDSEESINLLKAVISANQKLINAATDNKNNAQQALLQITRNSKKTAFYQQH